MESPAKTTAWIVFWGIIVFAILKSEACTIAFRVPTNFFPNTNEQGQLSCWWKIAEIPISNDGQKIPIILNFNSNRESCSPYCGKGFALFPLESSFIQEDQQSWLMLQPDGWRNYFGKSQPTGTTLKGASNWAAEMRDNMTTIWTDCGWKLEYVNAKIVGMSDKNHRIDFVRSGPSGAVTEMRCAGASLLRVESDPITGKTKALVCGDKRIGIEWGNRPRILPLSNGKGMTRGEDRCLAKLIGSDDSVIQQFVFGTNNQTQPTLKLTAKDKQDLVLTWDAKSHLLLTENDWSYFIKPGPNPRDNAAIERKNLTGDREFWFKDNAKGQELFEKNGYRKLTTWFTGSRLLAGKLRREEEYQDGKRVSLTQMTYNEKGQPIRKYKNGMFTHYEYDQDGSLDRIRRVLSNEPEVKKQIEDCERNLTQKVEQSTDEESRDKALYNLTAHYIYQQRNITKAQQTAANIKNAKQGFNLRFVCIQENDMLPYADKIKAYQELLQKYPEQRALVEKAIASIEAFLKNKQQRKEKSI